MIKEMFRCAIGTAIATIFACIFLGTIYGIVWLFLMAIGVIK